MSPEFAHFDDGFIAMGYIVAGAFFMRFWRRTRDHLFTAFGAAFWLMALNQIIDSLSDIPPSDQSPTYLLRLSAFVLIIVAIWWKNRDHSAPRDKK
ncbi:MAG TPA: DUF5985 family protein [Beijerinckiaceae bacterium]|nr:DUF5985 family protein [Beijerinckiaceae bacterium]